MIKYGIVYVKDTSFDSERIDAPYIIEAYIPEEHNLRPTGEGLQLANRNELRHAVGVVAARSLKYFSTNGEGFNISRIRDMYGVKTIVGSKYKGAGVNVTHGITKNLTLMAEKTLEGKNEEITPQKVRDEIKKMKVVILDRPRHEKLIKTVKEIGVQLIPVKA